VCVVDGSGAMSCVMASSVKLSDPTTRGFDDDVDGVKIRL
jgi:hypothetical protein